MIISVVPPGWYLPLYLCLDHNECQSDPCYNGGTCHDRPSHYTCTCPSGWQGTRCNVGRQQSLKTWCSMLTVKFLIQAASNPKTYMILVSSCRCFCSIHLSQVLSGEWRCCWSSADRRCSNYIWVINNFIDYWCATYNRGLTVYFLLLCKASSGQNTINRNNITSDSTCRRWTKHPF